MVDSKDVQVKVNRALVTAATAIQDRVDAALIIAGKFGPTDGVHHKAWVIDQMVRALTGSDYEEFVKEYSDDAETSEWDTGIAP